MANEERPIQTPQTIKNFARTLDRYVPMRTKQVRNIGRLMRAKTAPRGKR